MRRIILIALVALGLAAAVAGVRACHHAPATGEPASVRYQCPMHPSYVSDKPGNCPICGMKLVPMAPSPGPEATHAGHESPASDHVAVTLSPERLRMLGVHSEPAVVAELDPSIRTVGRVAVDERRIHHIHTKIEGYIEELYVDFTGKFVKRGEPLALVFSPEVVATQEEYLLALRAQRRLAASQVPSVAKGGGDLLEAARQRLLLWDIAPATIDRLERTGEVKRSLELFSPVSGYVVQKTAVHGMRAMPQDTLFDIADLSHLWVLADVYEQDLALVRLGMPAELSVTYLPGRTWTGSVTWIAPMVDEKTRTVKVRVEVENADEQLKPEMFADVSLRAPAGRGVVIPEGSIIRSGERNLVFVDEGQGRFAPREVRLGRKGASGVEVKTGLAEGERVITSANFLLDSESSLKAALAAMSRPGARGASTPGAPDGAPAAAAPVHQH
jgi:Cu(I)/Ag(I) efflux system membrane fusion protein